MVDETTEGESSGDLTFTRRTALALLGAGGAAAAATGSASATHSESGEGKPARKWNQDVDAQCHDLDDLHSVDVDHVFASAREAHVIVWKDDDGMWHADGRDGHVATTDDVMLTTNAAMQSLTDDRDWKEKVTIVSPATVGPHSWGEGPWPGYKEIRVPSHTILDVPLPVRIEDEDEPLIRAIYAKDAENVEFPNLNIKGNPRYAVWLRSVQDVRIGHVNIEMDADQTPRGRSGVRFDQTDGGDRCRDVQIGSARLIETGHHAFETYGMDRLQVDQLIGVRPINGVVNLNQTTDATINSLVAEEPGYDSHYAGLRLANHCENISVGQLVSRGGYRGFMVTASQPAHKDVAVGEVVIEDAESNGILIGQSRNIVVDGGVVKNCGGEPVRIHSQPYRATYSALEGITLRDLRIVDTRDEAVHEWAIRETGPYSGSNRIEDNDVRDGGTEGGIEVSSSSSIVQGNLGDGLASGSVTLTTGADPAATVPGVADEQGETLELRAKPFEGPDAAFAWDHFFAWNPETSEWDLHVEWRMDPGEDLTLDYIVDRPQANIGRGVDTEKETPPEITEGTYRVDAVHSGKPLTATEDGDVVQSSWTGSDRQRWEVTDLGGGSYTLSPVGSDLLLQVEGASEEQGANVNVGESAGDPYQHWRIEGFAGGFYRLQVLHTMQVANVAGADQVDGANVVQWPWTGGAGNELWDFEAL